MDADKWTDAAIARLEKRINEQYSQAAADLDKTWQQYIKGYTDGDGNYHKGLADRYAEQYKAYQDGKYTDAQFQQWYYNQVGRGEHWQQLKEQMADRLTNANQVAASYVNDTIPGIFTTNSNWVANLAQQAALDQGITGVKFDLVDEWTVRNLMAQHSDIFPIKPLAINLPRDQVWNLKKLQNALLQGVLQGDSIGHIADRFQNVTNMDRAAAIRNARTACTGAQNYGKQDRYNDLAKKGCYFTKIWVAVDDDRTRPEHAEANGQEVDHNEFFEVGGEELEYPGDKNGSDWNIYNCRCTMKTGKIHFTSNLSDEARENAHIRIV